MKTCWLVSMNGSQFFTYSVSSTRTTHTYTQREKEMSVYGNREKSSHELAIKPKPRTKCALAQLNEIKHMKPSAYVFFLYILFCSAHDVLSNNVSLSVCFFYCHVLLLPRFLFTVLRALRCVVWDSRIVAHMAGS